MPDRLSGLLGLSRRAGRLIWGYDAVLKAVASGEAKLVVLAEDTAPHTAKRIEQACETAGIDRYMLPFGKEMLGRAIGRADTAVAAVSDDGFSEGIRKYCRNITGGINYDDQIQGP